MDQLAKPLPAEFWSGPVVAAALATCNFATLFTEIRRAHGWSQYELATAVGYSQSWVSNVVRGRQVLTVDQVRDISIRLAVPVHLLRFGGQGGDDPTKRRDFGKAMTVALIPLPSRAEPDEATAPALMAITGAQRRLDAATPAKDLARGVAAHVDVTNRVLARAQDSPFAADVAAAASEAAGFAAWLHADMCDTGTARSHYRLAIDRAQRAGNDLLACYMTGSLAAFEIDGEDPAFGLSLVRKARSLLGRTQHATPRAWLDCIGALGLAVTGKDQVATSSAITRASRAIHASQAATPPPWPWVFPFDHAKLASYRALVAVRLNRPAEALAAFAEASPAAQPAPKQRAVMALEVATAISREGASNKDSDRVDQAFRLAREALRVGTDYSSEKVITRARRFRREYGGPASAGVREFDDQAHAIPR